MKDSLLFLALFFVFFNPSYSQVRTGGAGAPSPDTLAEAANVIQYFEKHLLSRDKECSPLKPRLNDPDLMQSYIKLSLLKVPDANPYLCSEANSYFACFVDVATEANVQKLSESKLVPVVLAERYKIELSEAEKMVKFFEQLVKKSKTK